MYDRTYAELAVFYGVSVGTIRNVLRRHKITPRNSGRRRNDGEDVRQYKEEIKNKRANESTV